MRVQPQLQVQVETVDVSSDHLPVMLGAAGQYRCHDGNVDGAADGAHQIEQAGDLGGGFPRQGVFHLPITGWGLVCQGLSARVANHDQPGSETQVNVVLSKLYFPVTFRARCCFS